MFLEFYLFYVFGRGKVIGWVRGEGGGGGEGVY